MEISLRNRKRLDTMRRAQRCAMERFLDRGFDAVTVEEIADAVDVSAMTLYRHFGAKEGLVTWDEYDPPILEEISHRLPDGPPLEAIRDGLLAVIDLVYDRDRELALDRVQLVHREPALLAASDRNGRVFRRQLTEIVRTRGSLNNVDAQVVAAVAVGLLGVVVEQWQSRDGKVHLSDLIVSAFASVAVTVEGTR